MMSPGNVRLSGKFTTKNDGVDIECWNNSKIDDEFRDILRRHRYSGTVWD